MDADFNDDLVRLTKTPAQVKSWLQSLEIGFNVNLNKTDFIYFKQNGVISTLNGQLLKLVVHFTYLGRNISSTESDVNIFIGKAWTATDWLLTIWKSDKIKWEFFWVVTVSTIVCFHHFGL